MLTMERLVEILKEHFGPPFLPEGHVRTRLGGEGTPEGSRHHLTITIGRRDVQIDEDGKVLGSGTCVAEGF